MAPIVEKPIGWIVDPKADARQYQSRTTSISSTTSMQKNPQNSSPLINKSRRMPSSRSFSSSANNILKNSGFQQQVSFLLYFFLFDLFEIWTIFRPFYDFWPIF